MVARIGVVAGMRSELAALGRWARDPRVATAVSGARPDRAEAEARRLAGEGVGALVSWGIAGGLDPALGPGALVLGTEVIDEAGARRPLHAPAGPRAFRIRLLGVDRPLMTVAEKARAAAEGAAAADMETHRVARAGVAAGVPVIALRAVADPAGRALPALAAGAVGADGRPRIAHVLAGLAANPRALPDLLQLRRDSAAAHLALAQAADAIFEALFDEA